MNARQQQQKSQIILRMPQEYCSTSVYDSRYSIFKLRPISLTKEKTNKARGKIDLLCQHTTLHSFVSAEENARETVTDIMKFKPKTVTLLQQYMRVKFQLPPQHTDTQPDSQRLPGGAASFSQCSIQSSVFECVALCVCVHAWVMAAGGAKMTGYI